MGRGRRRQVSLLRRPIRDARCSHRHLADAVKYKGKTFFPETDHGGPAQPLPGALVAFYLNGTLQARGNAAWLGFAALGWLPLAWGERGVAAGPRQRWCRHAPVAAQDAAPHDLTQPVRPSSSARLQGTAYSDVPEGTYYPALSLWTHRGQQSEAAEVTCNFGDGAAGWAFPPRELPPGCPPPRPVSELPGPRPGAPAAAAKQQEQQREQQQQAAAAAVDNAAQPQEMDAS